jgi:transcriptional regulator with GAF, ATPase, and Fis domain/Flp pilus assembly protein TadD
MSNDGLFASRYLLGRTLGAGGGGTVRLARDRRRPGALVAVKQIAASTPEEGRARLRELRLLRSLRHPGIARALDGGLAEDGAPYLVTEYVDGVPLSAALRRANPRARETLVTRFLEALAYLHGRGLLHRDLKPENVLVPRSGPPRVKLLDLGLSLPEGTSLRRRDRPGTPRYAAPEVVAGQGARPASDLWSLGVILDRALPRRPADDATRRVREVLLPRCLAEDPGRRFTDAVRALEAWRTAGSRAPAAAPPPARSGALHGRAPLLARLRSLLRSVRAGKGRRTVLVTGAPGTGKTRLLEEVRYLAQELGLAVGSGEADAPVVLADDAHRLGRRALAALRAPRDATRLVLLAGVPEPEAWPDGLPRADLTERLGPLPLTAVRAWAREAFRAAGLPERIAARGAPALRAATGGVPLLVEEALAAWLRRPGDAPPVPDSVRARAALEGGTRAPLERSLVDAAAALGRAAPAALLAAAAGLAPEEATAAIERLVRHGGLARGPEAGTFVSGRPSARAAGAPGRRALHARLAQALASEIGGPALPGEVARHRLESGDGKAAAEALDAAAAAGTPPDRALALADAVLRAPGVAAPERERAFARACELALAAGRLEDATRLGRSWARVAPAGPARAAALERHAEAERRLGRRSRARTLLTRGLRELPASGDQPVALRILNALGYLEFLEGRPRPALERARAGLARARPGPEAASLRNLEGLALHRLGDAAGAVRAHREAIRLFQRADVPADEAAAWTNLGNVLLAAGTPLRAAAAHRRALRLFRKLGRRDREAVALNNLGLALRARRDLAGARTAFEEARALYDAQGDPFGAASARGNLGTVLLLQGDAAAALAALGQAETFFRNGRHAREEAVVLRHRVRALIELRRFPEARTSAARAERLARHHGLQTEEAEGRAARGEALERGGAPEEGAALLRDAAARLRQLGLEESAASASLRAARGLLRAALLAREGGRESRAVELFQAARAEVPPRAGDPEARREVVDLLRRLRRPAEEPAGPGAGLARLVEINRRLTSPESPGQLLRAVLDAALELTGARRGFVILRAGSDEARFEAARHLGRDELSDPSGSVSRSVLDRVLRTGAPVWTDNAMEDRRFAGNPSLVQLRLHSVACVPLKVRGRIRGALYLDHPGRPGLFGHGSLRWLRALADQAALIIAGLRQRRRILALNRRLRALVRARTRELQQTREALRHAEMARGSRFHRMIGRSPAMTEVFQLVERLAPSPLPVLVEGETGTGKELVARALHELSPRKKGPFVSVNCAALPEALVESELFGHVRGGFTGAVGDAPGLFRAAHGGTLFLDEVGDLPAPAQAKLLRALEGGEVRPVGGNAPVQVDVRVISATNRDLDELRQAGRFRDDLYYRLKAVRLRLPPLRERREDIPLLLSEFLASAASEAGSSPKVPDAEALRRLLDYDWPGNVRELLNEARRLAAFPGPSVNVEALSPEIRAERAPAVSNAPGPDTLRQAALDGEARVLRAALESCGGNKTRAAALLGLSRLGLRKKLSRCGLI